MKVTIDLEKSVEENAAVYYDMAKKAKKKLEGARKAVGEAKEKQEVRKKAEKLPGRSKRFWFEKYKWFYSSDGFLVIAGKDADTNEEVVKKHTSKEDLVFHTEMAGSPFVIIKSEGEEVSSNAKEEAASYTASNSKAWELNLSSLEVFCVSPSQVSKEAKSGEYIEKGSFMIYGKRERYEVELGLSIGILEYQGEYIPMIGPFNSVKSNCSNQINIRQGSLTKDQAANKLMKHLRIKSNDDILSQLPQGFFEVDMGK